MIEKICPVCNKTFIEKQRPKKFCSRPCYWKGMSKYTGEKSSRWKGGEHRMWNGYILIKLPNHPMADSKGYIKKHRLIMSEHLGRILDRKEIVHHINHKKDDNRIDNLMLIKNLSGHLRLHWKQGDYDDRLLRNIPCTYQSQSSRKHRE
jgi:hypothetical protein